MHNISRIQFNILDHTLVPNISILNEDEKNKFIKDFSIRSTKQLPELSRFDPQALAISLRPGDICKIIRDSATALKTNYYRVCV
jgi:DNA-directed RNA polymerase subunit H (RpoH/RPB5)